MNKIKHFFSSPILADETLSRRASLLSFVVNLHLVIAVGVAIIYGVLLKERLIFPLMALLSCLPALGVRALIHRGKVTLGALIFIGLVAAFVPALAFLSGYSVGTVPVTAFQFVTIVMAGLLLGGRGAFGFFLFTSAVDGLMLYAEANDWYSVELSVNLQEIWVTQTITYLAVAILLWLANRLIQESFRRALYESEERRAAEASLQLAADAARLGAWTADIASGQVSFSDRLAAIHGGHTPDKAFSNVHPQDRERAQQTIVSMLSGRQERYAITHRIVLPDGTVRWVDSWGQLSRGRDGKPARIAGVMMDITERMQAEQALQESERKYRYLVDSSLVGIYITQNHILKFCNQRFVQMFGYQAHDPVVGKHVSQLVAPESWELVDARVKQREAGETDAIQYRFKAVKKDGTVFDVEVLGTRILYEGKPAIQGTMMDITERVRAEAEREVLIAELEAKNAELERFTYTVSHDLKAPLITVRGFLGLLEKDSASGSLDRVKDDMSRIVEATDKMQRLLGELLELSRIGRMMNLPQAVPFEAIVREALELVHGRIEARGAQVSIAPDLPIVYGDRARLVEVVQNLVDNACKFMGDQPEPRIEIGQRGADADGKPILFVRDNGIGIEPQYHDKVFGLFDKLDAQTEGTGVGLALVKRVVEVHGGRIWVESEGLGHGSTFCFTLPVAN